MTNGKDNSSFVNQEMERWLKELYLDPLTSYLDETMFRLDIFETEEEYIIEAILTDYECGDISVYLNEGQLHIKAQSIEIQNNEEKIRIIDFPFNITTKQVHASFLNGILEIFISKTITGSGKNRFISIS